MRDILEQIERTIESASTTVAEQEQRVARQRARIEELELHEHHDLAEHARGVLKLMEEFLGRTKRELAEAEQRREACLAQKRLRARFERLIRPM